MTRPTTVVLAAVLLVPGAIVRADATSAKAEPANARQLQGAWEGVQVGQESAGAVAITFSGNALHFQGPTADKGFDATFTLKEGTRPRQLHATLTGSPQGKDIGRVIGAVVKVENCTLSLAGLKDGAPSILDEAEAFDENPMFHYRFRRGEAKAKKAAAPKPAAPSPWAPWNPLQRPE